MRAKKYLSHHFRIYPTTIVLDNACNVNIRLGSKLQEQCCRMSSMTGNVAISIFVVYKAFARFYSVPRHTVLRMHRVKLIDIRMCYVNTSVKNSDFDSCAKTLSTLI